MAGKPSELPSERASAEDAALQGVREDLDGPFKAYNIDLKARPCGACLHSAETPRRRSARLRAWQSGTSARMRRHQVLAWPPGPPRPACLLGSPARNAA
jgi:hypothetical protein